MKHDKLVLILCIVIPVVLCFTYLIFSNNNNSSVPEAEVQAEATEQPKTEVQVIQDEIDATRALVEEKAAQIPSMDEFIAENNAPVIETEEKDSGHLSMFDKSEFEQFSKDIHDNIVAMQGRIDSTLAKIDSSNIENKKLPSFGSLKKEPLPDLSITLDPSAYPMPKMPALPAAPGEIPTLPKLPELQPYQLPELPTLANAEQTMNSILAMLKSVQASASSIAQAYEKGVRSIPEPKIPDLTMPSIPSLPAMSPAQSSSGDSTTTSSSSSSSSNSSVSVPSAAVDAPGVTEKAESPSL